MVEVESQVLHWDGVAPIDLELLSMFQVVGCMDRTCIDRRGKLLEP